MVTVKFGGDFILKTNMYVINTEVYSLYHEFPSQFNQFISSHVQYIYIMSEKICLYKLKVPVVLDLYPCVFNLLFTLQEDLLVGI